MTEECGTDALALLTLATHDDIAGMDNYLTDMANRDVDTDHVLIDLAQMASTAVHKMAALAHITPDDILTSTGTALAQHHQVHERLREIGRMADEAGVAGAMVFIVDEDGDDDD